MRLHELTLFGVAVEGAFERTGNISMADSPLRIACSRRLPLVLSPIARTYAETRIPTCKPCWTIPFCKNGLHWEGARRSLYQLHTPVRLNETPTLEHDPQRKSP